MNKVIIFDNDCNLCRNTVRFIRRQNKRAEFDFVPSQSDEGKNLIRVYGIRSAETNSVIFIKEDKSFLRSTAVLHIFREMGGFWRLLYGFIIVPGFVRDGVYRVVARHRGLV